MGIDIFDSFIDIKIINIVIDNKRNTTLGYEKWLYNWLLYINGRNIIVAFSIVSLIFSCFIINNLFRLFIIANNDSVSFYLTNNICCYNKNHPKGNY